MKHRSVLFALLVLAIAAPAFGTDAILLDDFEDLAAWSAVPADGVAATISPGRGENAGSLRLDFDFHGGGGYAVIHRNLAIDLPANYVFTFRLRGEAPKNSLECKLIDGSGDNVWWSVKRDFAFPEAWETVRLKKRQVSFAWGPLGGGEPTRVAAIEFAVTAGTGGKGTVWFNDLRITPLPPPNPNPPAPTAVTSSEAEGTIAAFAIDGDSATSWESAATDERPWIELDFGGAREFGGLVIDWAPGRFARDYDVELSDDGAEWRTVRTVRKGNGGRDYLFLPESESARVRIRTAHARPGGVGIREMAVEPLAWSATRNAFFEAIAKDAPRGVYPRGMSGEAVRWTVVGADGDRVNALISEDGAVEPWAGGFSIEPFLFADGRLFGWGDFLFTHRLDELHLPIPTIASWSVGHPELTVTAFATGAPGASSLVVRYRVKNQGGVRRAAPTLYLAIRPFQVNPPYQFLNIAGGTAPVRAIELDGSAVLVNGTRRIVALSPPDGFGATTFDEGDITDYLRDGRLPENDSADDPFEAASGAMAFRFDLAPGEEREVSLVIPLHEDSPLPPPMSRVDAPAWVRSELQETRATWEKSLDRVVIRLPACVYPDILYAQLAFILVNRSGPAIRPGTRAYARSWIRDGALTGAALLRMGHPEPVREFIEWFAGYQYENGKIPCCVDDRGADPVPEHDSSGEFIYLVAEYYRYTKDIDLVRVLWPRVDAAAEYLDRLRQETRTDENRTPETARFFGLLPPSISHEGYSAKPMHSYWDDFFAYRGFKDAVTLAGVLGLDEEKRQWEAVRDEFAADLAASVGAAMAFHGIDYVPGSADLGDFDPTSTTIALDPTGAADLIPRGAIERTFEKYWEFFENRRETKEWEAFTPYEMRNIGAFVRLGWREREKRLAGWFYRFRGPDLWFQWPEVVWRERRAPKFIGDMPHTWVGSDFIRSVLDMFAYVRESDETLVLCAGIPLDCAIWIEPIEVRSLRTPYGPLDYTIESARDSMTISIGAGLVVPPGGIEVHPPFRGEIGRALVDGAEVPVGPGGAVMVRRVPAEVTVTK